MRNLIFTGIGALMFWPSAKYGSFGGFCASLFIVGGGLSTLETSADPYLAICGPPRLSEFRLETAQGFQAIGSVIAPIVAARAFFNVDSSSLVSFRSRSVVAMILTGLRNRPTYNGPYVFTIEILLAMMLT